MNPLVADVADKLAEIAEAIGMEAALLLSDHWPGVRLFVPKQMDFQHPIALAIGLLAAQKLSRRYGGETITVPKNTAWRCQVRNALIVEEYVNEKASGRDLARKWGLHENYIYQLIAKREAHSHPDLFEGAD